MSRSVEMCILVLECCERLIQSAGHNSAPQQWRPLPLSKGGRSLERGLCRTEARICQRQVLRGLGVVVSRCFPMICRHGLVTSPDVFECLSGRVPRHCKALVAASSLSVLNLESSETFDRAFTRIPPGKGEDLAS